MDNNINNLIAAMVSTPWWVWATLACNLFCALSVGGLALKSREVKLWILSILFLPLVLAASCISYVYTIAYGISGWAIAFILLISAHTIGAMLGRAWGSYHGEKPLFDLKNKTVTIAPSVLPLVLVLSFFMVIMIFGCLALTYPAIVPYVFVQDLLLFFIAGIGTGRSSFYIIAFSKRVKSVQFFGN